MSKNYEIWRGPMPPSKACERAPGYLAGPRVLDRSVRHAIVGGLVAACALSPVWAQEAARSSSTPQRSEDLETVVVTGSHLAVSSYELPTPVTMVTVQELTDRGVANVGDYLSYLPAFNAHNNPQNTTLWSLKNGATYMDLRGFGANRTLTLLDGRRFVASDRNALLDMNVFPTGLIERIDVVTGGASAVYGSDAIAGVVNVVTNKHFNGVKVDAQYGASQHGDATSTSGSFAAGGTLLGDRAHVVLSVDVMHTGGLATQNDRDWGRAAPCIMNNPAYTGPGSGSQQIVGYNCTLSTATTGGLIVSPGPLAGQQFGPGSVLEPFVPGTNFSPAAPFMSGGSGANMGADRPISVPFERYAAYGSFRYALTDDIELFVDATTAQSTGKSPTAQHWDFGSINIRADNAYLPSALRTQMTQNNISSFTMSRVNTDMGFYIAESKTNVDRFVVGAEGSSGGWNWNAYAQHGKTNYTNLQLNNRIQQNFTNAVDAVVNPATGAIVCRQTLTGGAPGCVPINLFGFGSPSAAANKYVHGTEFLEWEITEEDAAASVSREIPTLPSGPLAVAFGGEYRKESTGGSGDPLAVSGGYTVVSPVPPTFGSYHVTEGYVELAQPLLKDMPGADLLSLNAAYRYADYSTSGGADAWKIGLSYFPVSTLQLRGLVSRDIRAPNLAEAFSPPGGLSFSTINDPNTNSSYAIKLHGGGNPNLKVESAKTTSFGIVYKPDWIEGLAVSADYWDIKLSDKIGGLGAQQIINFCAAGNAQACDNITRDPASGLIDNINQTLFNIAWEKHTGVDIQSSYTHPLGSLFGDAAQLTLSLDATYTQHWSLSSDGTDATRSELAGQVGANVGGSGVPKWRGNVTADYAAGPLGFNARIRYVGGGKYINYWTTDNFANNNIGSTQYLDLSARYTFGESGSHPIEARFGIDNALDKDPLVNPETFFITGFTNYEIYDVMGRRFYAGARITF